MISKTGFKKKKTNLNEKKYAETQLDNPVGAQHVTYASVLIWQTSAHALISYGYYIAKWKW